MSGKPLSCCGAAVIFGALTLATESHGQTCDAVDLVFVMDSSASMADMSGEACLAMDWIADRLTLFHGDDVQVTKLGIIPLRQCPECSTCLVDITQFNVQTMFGSRVPVADPARHLDTNEDWGDAVSIVADRFSWRDNAVRLIIPVADEGPQNGNDSLVCPLSPTSPDQVSINDAIAAAANVDLQYNVIVAPLIVHSQVMSAELSCIEQLAIELSMATSVDPDNRLLGNALVADTNDPGLFSAVNNFADLIESDIFATFNGLCVCTETGADVDGNGVPDVCQDCNGNGLFDPDEINIDGIAEDCDGNGVPDGCQIAAEPSLDVDGNGVLDSCDPDCSLNGTPDVIDIFNGVEADCNHDWVPDSCDPDCNGNGISDVCDIFSASSDDCTGDGIPDECQVCECFGDLNCDCSIEQVDLDALLASWGSCGTCLLCPADLNGDRTVDVTDLLALLAVYGTCSNNQTLCDECYVPGPEDPTQLFNYCDSDDQELLLKFNPMFRSIFTLALNALGPEHVGRSSALTDSTHFEFNAAFDNTLTVFLEDGGPNVSMQFFRMTNGQDDSLAWWQSFATDPWSQVSVGAVPGESFDLRVWTSFQEPEGLAGLGGGPLSGPIRNVLCAEKLDNPLNIPDNFIAQWATDKVKSQLIALSGVFKWADRANKVRKIFCTASNPCNVSDILDAYVEIVAGQGECLDGVNCLVEMFAGPMQITDSHHAPMMHVFFYYWSIGVCIDFHDGSLFIPGAIVPFLNFIQTKYDDWVESQGFPECTHPCSP